MKKLLILLVVASTIVVMSCNKKDADANEQFYGKWIIKGTDGSGPAGTLNFYRGNNKNMLSFNCAGAPRPTWPDTAIVEYKFEGGKLYYGNYTDTSKGFNTVNSFKWISTGREFEAKRIDFLVFLSVIDSVRYVKVN